MESGKHSFPWISFFPQSPGSRPGLFMRVWVGGAIPSRPGKRAHERIAILFGNRSPQRELGDCDVAHQLDEGSRTMPRYLPVRWISHT